MHNDINDLPTATVCTQAVFTFGKRFTKQIKVDIIKVSGLAVRQPQI